MRILRRAGLSILFGAAALISGFAFLSPPEARAAEPRRGGVLTVHLNSEQRTLNPSLRASTGVYIVTGKIIEPLVDLDAEGNIVPVLATSWEPSPDGKTITFKLREGVKWHDGKPFTSADVQYNALELWKKHLNYSTTLQKDLLAVDTPDAHTAVFRYSQPVSPALLLRALTDLGHVVPRHIFEGTNVLENPANTAPIGTGPFRFVEYQRGQHIIAERNPDYWRKGYPYLDRIVWRVITDASAAAAAIESGQVQVSAYSALTLADIDRLGRVSDLVVTTRGSEANQYNNTLEFNLRNKIISDVRVRRAIAHAIDVPFFVKNFLYGQGQPATGIIPSTSREFYPAGAKVPYPFDRSRAEALLDQAGYKRGPDGNRFSLRLVYLYNGEDCPLFATFIQQSLAEIGIKAEIQNYDYAGALNAIYTTHEFDIATGRHQFRGDPAISTTVWVRSGIPDGTPWTNQFGWKSEKADKLIDDAVAELDVSKRRHLYAELFDLVNEEFPLWFPTERQFYTVVGKKVHNALNQARWASSSWYDTWIEP